MIKSIENNLKTIDTLLIMDQYSMMLKIAEDTRALILQNKNDSSVVLSKRVLYKIHELRYKLAYNKATTDMGELDVNLKKSWESLKALVD